MIAELNPYPDYKESGTDLIGQVPAHWDIQSFRTLIKGRSGRNNGDLPLLSVVREKGVIKRSVGDGNHNVIPQDLSNYKVVFAGDLVINKMKAWQGSLGVAPCDGIVSPAYYVYKFGIDNRAFGQALLRSRPYVGAFGRASDGVRVGQWDLSIDGMKQIPVLLPPPDEQAAIVRYLDYVTRRIERAIQTKRKLIALLNEQKQTIIHRAVTRGLDPNVPMRDSGVEWIGQIPAHWEVRRAKQVCSAIIDCKNRTPEMVESGEYTVVRTTNIRHGQFNLKGSYPTNRHNFEIWTQRGAPKLGDVFFTREAPTGEACLVPDMPNLCMGQRMMYFRPNPQLLNAKFFLNSIYGPVTRRYIDLAVNGSTVGHLRLGQVSALPLLWCSVIEQDLIVKFIDSESAPINDIINRTEREIKLLQEYRTRLIADVVTGKIDVREAAQRMPDDEPLSVVAEEIADDDEAIDEFVNTETDDE